jgi:uncharacterized membrane protein
MKRLALLVLPLLFLTACQDMPEPLAPSDMQLNHKPGHGGGDTQAGAYTLTQLDGRFTQILGLNDDGLAVGRISAGGDDPWRAKLWHEGTTAELDIPRSRFAGVNDSGTVIGSVGDESSGHFAVDRRGFLYRDGEMTAITGEHLGVAHDMVPELQLEGSLEDDRVQPWDINDHGRVIARALMRYEVEVDTGTVVRWIRYAFAWEEGEPITYIDGGQPTAVNNHGTVIGFVWHTADPAIWDNGSYGSPRVLTGLRDHFAGLWIELTDINDAGQILGVACLNQVRSFCGNGGYERRGFVYAGGVVTELPLPNRSDLTQVRRLNAAGQAVGTVRKVEGSNRNFVPTVWSPSSAGFRLEELPRGGHTHAEASAINDLGQVAGHANPWEALLWTRDEGKGDDGDPPGDGDDDNCNPHPRTGVCRG